MDAIIFCLPYAGGSRLCFKGMQKRNKSMKFIPIEYISYDDRVGDNNSDIIMQCCDTIIKYRAKEYYILGYSMGAIIGYEIIKELEKREYFAPLGLIIISCNSPDVGMPKFFKSNNSVSSSQIISLGGIPEKLRENTELLNLFVELIKYDLKLMEELLKKGDLRAINTDLMFFQGVYDNVIESRTCLNWGEFTNTYYYFKKLNDGHFINEHSEKVIINKILRHYEVKKEESYGENTHILF